MAEPITLIAGLPVEDIDTSNSALSLVFAICIVGFIWALTQLFDESDKLEEKRANVISFFYGLYEKFMDFDGDKSNDDAESNYQELQGLNRSQGTEMREQ